MNEAIKRACEIGKYRWKLSVTQESMLLDPEFWRCLGVAEGWNMKSKNDVVWRPSGHLPELCQTAIVNRDTPISYWLRAISWINEKKPIDTFFDELLAKE